MHPRRPSAHLVRLTGVALVALAVGAPASGAQARPAAARRAPTPPLSEVTQSLFANLEYRNVGPARGGRVTTVTGARLSIHNL